MFPKGVSVFSPSFFRTDTLNKVLQNRTAERNAKPVLRNEIHERPFSNNFGHVTPKSPRNKLNAEKKSNDPNRNKNRGDAQLIILD